MNHSYQPSRFPVSSNFDATHQPTPAEMLSPNMFTNSSLLGFPPGQNVSFVLMNRIPSSLFSISSNAIWAKNQLNPGTPQKYATTPLAKCSNVYWSKNWFPIWIVYLTTNIKNGEN